jgi:hypothetical protein
MRVGRTLDGDVDSLAVQVLDEELKVLVEHGVVRTPHLWRVESSCLLLGPYSRIMPRALRWP